MRNRPDGVYKTNENLINYLPSNSSLTTLNQIIPTIKFVDPLVNIHLRNDMSSKKKLKKLYSDSNLFFTKEYFC